MPDWDQFDNGFEMASAMWAHVVSSGAADLSPEEFQNLFHRVYAPARDIPTLWQLGGATNSYLHFRPGTVTFPTELPMTLLHSNDVDARIIGLKLLNRCDVNEDLIIVEIIRAIERRDTYETVGGLRELHIYFDRLYSNGSRLSGGNAKRLQQVLASVVDSEDEIVRDAARYLSEYILEL